MPYGQRLSDDILLTSDPAVVAGTTTIDSTPVDMAGFSGVMFIVKFGTPAANNTIRAQQDVIASMAAAADLAGSLVASGANITCVLEVMYTAEQFLRCRITRGTSTTIDSITAIRFGARNGPTTITGASFETWQQPSEGTA